MKEKKKKKKKKSGISYSLLLEIKQAVSSQGAKAALPEGRELLIHLKVTFLVSAEVPLVLHFGLLERTQFNPIIILKEKIKGRKPKLGTGRTGSRRFPRQS